MTEIINKIIDWIAYFKSEIDSIKNSIKEISSNTGNNAEEISKMKERLSVLEKTLP